MRIASLVAAGGDRVERDAARAQAGGLDGELQVFRRQLSALVVKPAAFDPRAAQQVLSRRDAEGGTAVARAQRRRFGRALDLALGENHPDDGDDAETLIHELESDAGGK